MDVPHSRWANYNLPTAQYRFQRILSSCLIVQINSSKLLRLLQEPTHKTLKAPESLQVCCKLYIVEVCTHCRTYKDIQHNMLAKFLASLCGLLLAVDLLRKLQSCSQIVFTAIFHCVDETKRFHVLLTLMLSNIQIVLIEVQGNWSWTESVSRFVRNMRTVLDYFSKRVAVNKAIFEHNRTDFMQRLMNLYFLVIKIVTWHRSS